MLNTLEKGCEIFRDLWANELDPSAQFQGPTIHALEFGVLDGTTLRTLVRELASTGVPVIGFDAFLGLPEDWTGTPHKAGLFTREGIVPKIEGAEIRAGWFNKTVVQYMHDSSHAVIGLLHLDCDLYSSTLEVLYGLTNMIVPGTVIVCDEWIYNQNPHCNDHQQRAFHQWVKFFGRTVARVEWSDETLLGCERALFVVVK